MKRGESKLEGDHDNLVLVVGQLLEATKATAESLRHISDEVNGHTVTMGTIAQALETIDEAIEKIDNLVHDAANPHNLLATTNTHGANIDALRQGLQDQRDALVALKKTVDDLVLSKTVNVTAASHVSKLVVGALKFLAWVVGISIAVYAAITQAK